MSSFRRGRAVALEDKMPHWIIRRLNVLSDAGRAVSVSSEVKSAFDKLRLHRQAISTGSGEVEQVFADASIKLPFIVGLDRAPR